MYAIADSNFAVDRQQSGGPNCQKYGFRQYSSAHSIDNQVELLKRKALRYPEESEL
jgi:hypothetical protein